MKPYLETKIIIEILVFNLLILSSGTISAQNEDIDKNVEEVVVYGVEERLTESGRLKDDVVQTEVVTSFTLEKLQAGSLTQSIQNQPGVRVSTECSMCGVKRVMINGLKGEHTTLMLDGVPNSSLIEGFYGFDAVPTAGVDSVEISRGSGSALIAPEAIGGVVNVITFKPKDNGFQADLSTGSEGYHKYQVVGKMASDNERTKLIIAGQSDNINQYDYDDNLINEAPKLKNSSIMAKIWHDLTPNSTINFKVTNQKSEVFGGPMLGSFIQSRDEAANTVPGIAPDFIGGNVGNLPDFNTSTARDWLENIITTKQEYTGKWLQEINTEWNVETVASHVKADMDAIYEGVTYLSDQEINYFSTKANNFSIENHSIAFGFDYKSDKANTKGTTWNPDTNLFDEQSPNDAYTNKNTAVYIRDIWTQNEKLEISGALRVDDIEVDFIDQNRQFNETLFAPRLHMRYDHNLNWISRFSTGVGYRVPLQFFESEHGIIDQGFAVAVEKLEKSKSARYSLSFAGLKSDITSSVSTTAVKNLAVLENVEGIPTLVSTNFKSRVSHFDITGNYTLGEHEHWSLEGTIERFFYDENYRSTFVVIPVEERIRLGVDYSGHEWDVNINATWIGSRNYADYTHANYGSHYDDLANTISKGTSSPSFITANMKISNTINEKLTVYAGINNVFDYTQTSEGDSPLFYHEDGSWDVIHIWGPLRGRTIYTGIKVSF